MASIDVVQGAGYYRAFLERTKESDECYTHLALIHSTPRGGFTGYVKFYPDDIRKSKGLANETCGYLLAQALGLPIPKYGIILLLEGERLIEAHSSLEDLLVPTVAYPTWVTEQVNGVPIAPNDNKALEQLIKWPSLPELIAFDDWVINADRSLENILRGKNKQFSAIDFGHIFGGLYWDQDLLTQDWPFRHRFVDELWDGNPPRKVKNQILEAAKQHDSAFSKIRGELDKLLSRLLENQEDKSKLLEFLERRASQSYHRVSKSLGVLL
jgi:hypothetical protein